MAKNIEMNYLDSGGYEVLYPKTIFSQVENLLSNTTKIDFGLTESATPDDVFQTIFSFLPISLKIKAHWGNNEACSNEKILVNTNSGRSETLITNENGEAQLTNLSSLDAPLSIKLFTDYMDINNEAYVVSQLNLVTEANVVFQYKESNTFTSSGTGTVSPQCRRVEVVAIGGGASGSAYAIGGSADPCEAIGGNSGKIKSGGRSIIGPEDLVYEIGSGGGRVSSTGNLQESGKRGGNTSFQITSDSYQIEAEGGNLSAISPDSDDQAVGGGADRDTLDGDDLVINQYGFSYTIYGGGGAWAKRSSSKYGTSLGGGDGYSSDNPRSDVKAKSATVYGSGGGGAAAIRLDDGLNCTSGAGKGGLLYIKFSH